MTFLNKKAIAVFDSGVGGLTVLSAIHRQLPCENLVYLGDTARVPYGSKSPQAILNYAEQAAQFLVNHDIKMLVLACNTVSSVALPRLTEMLDPIPVIGVIEASALKASQTTQNNHIAIIGTESTIHGGVYQSVIKQHLPDCRLSTQPCPLFVAFAEEGLMTGPEIEGIARRYLSPLFDVPDAPDTLVLGCTHFPMLRATLQKVLGDNIHLVDSADTTASLIHTMLKANDLLHTNNANPLTHYLVTDAPNRFIRTANMFIQQDFVANDVRWVDIANLSADPQRKQG